MFSLTQTLIWDLKISSDFLLGGTLHYQRQDPVFDPKVTNKYKMYTLSAL